MFFSHPQGTEVVKEPQEPPRSLTETEVRTPITASRITVTHLHYTPLGCRHGAQLIHTGCENAWWGGPACC